MQKIFDPMNILLERPFIQLVEFLIAGDRIFGDLRIHPDRVEEVPRRETHEKKSHQRHREDQRDCN